MPMRIRRSIELRFPAPSLSTGHARRHIVAVNRSRIGLAVILFLVITAAFVRAVPTMFTIGVILQYTYPNNTPYPDTDDVFAMTSLALPAMNALNPNLAQFQFVKGDSQGTRAGAIAAMLNISSTHPNPVAFIGDSTDLSDKTKFGRFFRTIQDDSQQGPALIPFVKAKGWGSMNLVTATDAYGTSIAASTIAAAPDAGITISTQSVVSPVATDFTSVIATLRTSLSNIIIFAMPTVVAREMLRQARDAGLVAPEYVWISTDIFSDYLSTSAALPTATEDIANADGAFYVYPRAATETDAYAALLAAWARVSSRALLNVPYGTLCYDCAVTLARGIVPTVLRRGVAALTSATGNLTLAEFMPPAHESVSGTVHSRARAIASDFQNFLARMKQYSNAKLLRAVIAVQSALYAVRTTVFASAPELVTSKSTVSCQCVPRDNVGDRVIVGASLALNIALLVAVVVLRYKLAACYLRSFLTLYAATFAYMALVGRVALAAVHSLTASTLAMVPSADSATTSTSTRCGTLASGTTSSAHVHVDWTRRARSHGRRSI
ncbi:hypothetical protein GGF31_007984 [Allomyces arbusculus]|nr:hypothetical protein GGF31_007984 [Allomyces arbusculus]